MNTSILKLAAVCSPALALAAMPARAGFDPAVVPADAQWVFYLDVNALRTSALGAELMTMIPALDLDSEDLPVKINVPKLIESLGSATAYGTTFSHDPKDIDGALIVRGTADLRKMVQGLLLASLAGGDESVSDLQVKELTGLGSETYEVQGELLVALPAGDAILVSKSKERLAAAQALLSNDRGSLARSKDATLAMLIPKSATTYLLAASMVPRDHDLMRKSGPEARILQMASAASVSLGEDGSMTTARIQINATSADMADKLIKILQGFVAMLSFAETDDAALAAFLRSVTVEKTPSGALLNLAYPTDRLVEMLKTVRDDHAGDASDKGQGWGSMGRASVEGRIVAEWTADKDLGNVGPAAENIVTHTVENITLKTGDMIWLNGSRSHGEHARFDYLEIASADKGAAPMRFEAENMRLNNYAPEEAAFASAGELIILRDSPGSARLVFPGAAGTYTLTVAYLDESDGQSGFSLSISEPKSQPGPEAPKS